MFRIAIFFLILALVAGVLGFSGVMGAAINIAWLLAIVGIVLFAVHAFSGRTPA